MSSFILGSVLFPYTLPWPSLLLWIGILEDLGLAGTSQAASLELCYSLLTSYLHVPAESDFLYSELGCTAHFILVPSSERCLPQRSLLHFDSFPIQPGVLLSQSLLLLPFCPNTELQRLNIQTVIYSFCCFY